MPHSSASHQSSAVLEEVASTIGTQISIRPHPFDEISPIAISQGEFRDDHGLLARRVEQINCRPDAARPLHNQSVRFDVLQRRVASGLLLDTKITVPACLSVCIDPLTLPDSTLSPLAFDWP